MCRRAALALNTCFGACLGVNRAKLKRLLGASFRRECLSFLDVSFVGAESLPSRKPCKLSSTLLNELVLLSVLAPLCSAVLRSPPLNELFAFDASDSRAGGCRAPVSEDQWRSLYDLSEERREHVRLDWGSCLSRGSPSTRLRLRLTSTSTYSKLRALSSLLRHLASEGQHDCRVLALTNSRAALGASEVAAAAAKRTTSSRKPLLSVSATASSSTSFGSQRGATLQTRLPETSLSPPGATHFGSCTQYRPQGCCLNRRKTNSAS